MAVTCHFRATSISFQSYNCFDVAMCFVWRDGQIGNPHPTVADSFPGLHQACLQVLIPLLIVMERTWHCWNGKKEQLWTDSPNFWTILLLCWNTSLYMLELARSSLYVKVVDQRAIQASSPCKLTYRDYNHQGVPSVLHSNKRERQRNWSHIQLHFLAHPSLRKNSRDPNLCYNCQSCDTKVIMNQVNVSKKAISRRQQYSRILPGHACKNIRSSIFPKKAVVIIILDSMEDKWKNF